MDQIEVEILQGPYAGKAAVFDPGELPFGRSPNNAIVIDVPEVSREHGLIRCDDDGWKVVNLSVNGTTVNGKAIKKEARPLRTGDRVGVGKFPLFKVLIVPAEPDDDEAPAPYDQEQEDAAHAAPADGGNRKQQVRMYLAIAGVLAGALFIAIAVLAPLSNDGPGATRNLERLALSSSEIERIITRPLDVDPGEREAQAALERAREAYRARDVEPENLYEAYYNYKLAEAYEEKKLLDGMAFREYQTAEDDLVERISDLYFTAFNQVRDSQWEEAEQTCWTIIREYRRSDDPITENAHRLLRIARSRQSR